MSVRKYERKTFGISNGQKGIDDQTPPDGMNDEDLDSAGNGHALVQFRGRWMTPWYRNNILRTEQSRRVTRRVNRRNRDWDRIGYNRPFSWD